MAAGKVIIEAELNTNKFEYRLHKLEQKLKNYEVDFDINSGDIEQARYELELANLEYNKMLKSQKATREEIESKAKQYKSLLERAELSKQGLGPNLTAEEGKRLNILWNDMDSLKDKQKELDSEANKYNSIIEKANENLAKLELKQDRLKQKIVDTHREMTIANQQLELNEAKTAEKARLEELKEIENSAKDASIAIKDINKGLTSAVKKVVRWGLAIFGVRSAYLAIRQAMSMLSNENEDMKASIDYIKWALAQVLKPIVEWIINAMIKLLQYINYIAYAWFKINLFGNASAKAFKNANGQAKKLQKTLAGFDEMNVLSSNNNSNTGTPWADLSTILSDVEVPAWIKWIAENKDVILTVLGALGVAFAASTISKWISNLKPLLGVLGKGSGLLGLLESIIGIGAIAITIYFVGKILEEAKELAGYIDTINEKNKEANKNFAKDTENINALLNTQNVQRDAGYQILEDSESVLSKILGLTDSQLKTLENTVINSGLRLDKEYELYKAGKLNADEKQRVLNDTIQQLEYNKKVIDRLKEEGIETSNLEEINKRLVGYANNMYKEVYKTNDELYDLNSMQIQDKDMKIKVDADVSQAEKKTSTWWDNLKKGFKNFMLSTITFEDGHFKWNQYKGNAKGAIYYPPKLGVGGIINRPGRGIPIGSAIGGERGAEGVIPLTDSQQMALLGEAIGKYINVHVTNVTELDGRTIARKVQEISNNNNFLMNR